MGDVKVPAGFGIGDRVLDLRWTAEGRGIRVGEVVGAPMADPADGTPAVLVLWTGGMHTFAHPGIDAVPRTDALAEEVSDISTGIAISVMEDEAVRTARNLADPRHRLGL